MKRTNKKPATPDVVATHIIRMILNAPVALPMVIDLDGPLHTDAHPFCSDATCPCHHDCTYKWEHVGKLLADGTITQEAAFLRFSGQSCDDLHD